MTLTGEFSHLALALAAFIAAHSATTLPLIRDAAIARLGKVGFYGLYSVLSTILLVWVVAAALAAPAVILWPQQPWMRWVPSLLMPAACLLWVIGLSTPNPFSIGPGGGRYDPARPGILRLTRHPVVWGLGLWAAAHIVPNGNLAGLVLFAPLLAMSALGPRILDAKRRRSLGEAEWRRLAEPLAGPVEWRALLAEIGPLRIGGGLALVAALMALHPAVIGLSPYP